MIKRLMPLLFFACCLMSGLEAQNDGPFAQRIEAMKAAFITDQLRLTPEESQQFWPLYNQYQNEEQQLRKQYQAGKPVPDMSEEEAKNYLDRILELEQKLLELKGEYIQRFQKVIPTRKVALLPKVEEEFKKELLKRIQERRRRSGNR